MSRDEPTANSVAALTLPTPAAGERVTLAHAPHAQRLVVRGDAAVAALAETGWTLTREPHRAHQTGDMAASTRAALWLGPDEWLLLDEHAPSTDGLAEHVTAAQAGRAYSVVDVSDCQIGVRVSGPAAQAALAMFVPLDLAATAFAVGMATRTVFEKAEIVLWRRAEDVFHIEVWRSFAPYVATLLTAAQREIAAEAVVPRR